jgi:acetyl esterase
MISIDPTPPTPLNIGQHLSVAGVRTFFGAVTGALRLLRGSPRGWRTVRYGLHRDEILDVRRVEGRTRSPVVFYHGGGWMMGTKDFYSHDLCFLGEAGFPVFNVEYPKAPEHPHPWILRSVLKSLAFVRKSFDDGAAVHVMGDSAGGNLAVMAAILAGNPEFIPAVDPDFDAATLPKILSATSIYGVMDRGTCLGTGLPGGHTMIEAYGGSGCLGETVDAAHAITPMDLAFANHPPCFLGCGDKDIVLPSTHIYAARLAEAGHPATVRIYPNATHGYFNFPEGKTKMQSQQDIAAFLLDVER